MLEGHEPDEDTQYRIGSLTKTFIAVLVMRLRDEGRLDLADPLGKHLDAGQAASVTIAQLLSHTAGLASETPGPWWERSPGDLRPALADIFGTARHPAGRLFHYSNPGYGLLGALVGRLHGHGWEQALRQEILDPLGMTRTTASPEEPYARGFAVHGGPPLPWTVTTLGSLGTGGTPMVTKYQKFADGYKAEAVKLYRESNQTIAETARNLGLKESTLANWVKKDKDNEAVAVGEAPLTPAERTRIRELEADVRRLNMENAFLKKASAYFASQNL